MYSIRSEDDLSQMIHLSRKKNILARFVMNGCHWCEESQPEWDTFTSRYSGDLALAEIESSFLQHFQQIMTERNAPVQVNGYPTILLIRASKVTTVPSLQKIQKRKKSKTKNTKKTKKAKKTKKSKRT
jgi:hypothetical protein